MSVVSVRAAIRRLEQLVELLRDAADGSEGTFHEERRRSLAGGLEKLLQPLERIASAMALEDS
jgi:hypothetical protein